MAGSCALVLGCRPSTEAGWAKKNPVFQIQGALNSDCHSLIELNKRPLTIIVSPPSITPSPSCSSWMKWLQSLKAQNSLFSPSIFFFFLFWRTVTKRVGHSKATPYIVEVRKSLCTLRGKMGQKRCEDSRVYTSNRSLAQRWPTTIKTENPGDQREADFQSHQIIRFKYPVSKKGPHKVYKKEIENVPIQRKKKRNYPLKITDIRSTRPKL